MLVPEEETLQEECLDGDTMAEDEVCFCSDAGVSSTAALPKPIPIPAPVRASICYQKAVKGHGTRTSSRPPGLPKSFRPIFPMLCARHWCCLLPSPECRGPISRGMRTHW